MDENIEKLIKTNKQLIIQNQQLLNEVNSLKITCQRMDNHITFIESTYNILRAPLAWFMNKWYKLQSIHEEKEDLPSLMK